MAVKITEQEKKMKEVRIGVYGRRWIEWMENNHKKKVCEMKSQGIFLDVAKSTDEYARDYKNLLDRQYEELHPRPYDFEGDDELRAWKFMRDFYTDGEVMRERVLIPFTKP